MNYRGMLGWAAAATLAVGGGCGDDLVEGSASGGATSTSSSSGSSESTTLGTTTTTTDTGTGSMSASSTTTTGPTTDPTTTTTTTDPTTSSTGSTGTESTGVLTEGTTTDDTTGSTTGPPGCGNGVVDDGEACDDGNDDDSDACTSLCAPPACDDGIQSGDESDLDCGGSCDPCGLGQLCGGDADCGQGACIGGSCQSAASCKELKALDDALADGLYMIDPDGEGPDPAIEAYCDMTSEGGGWTLIMKSIDANVDYDDPLWENAEVVGEDDYDFEGDGKVSKYRTFSRVGFEELRSSYPDDFANGYTHDLGMPFASAQALFSGEGIEIGTELIAYWNDSVPDTAKHFGCTTYINAGINQKKYLGEAFINGGGNCDWNGGSRFGQRVNANHGGTGNHAGQGWGAYSTIGGDPPVYYYDTKQLLWVR